MFIRNGILAAAGFLLCVPASAQTTRPAPDNAATGTVTPAAESRLERLERRLDEMERQHQSDLQSRDREIARLKALLEAKPAPPAASAAATPPTPAPAGDRADRATDELLDEINGTTTPSAATPTPGTTGTTAAGAAAREAVLRDAAGRDPFSLQRTPASFNPDFAVVGDYHGSVSTDNDNAARNRFDVGSVELDLRAAVDPRADGVVILPVSRDVPDPLFFRSKKGIDNPGPDTSIDIEEAYIFLHDFGVPNLTAKLGRFHLRFGRQNILHSHDWPTVDNNFVNQSFLGPESLNDSGLSLSYVIPPKLIDNQYVEVIAEIVTGEGDGGDPVVNNDAYLHQPALNLHALWNHDYGNWNLEVGGSFLTAKHDRRRSQDATLFGGDVTLIHTDPTGRFNNTLLQAEAIYGMVDTSQTATQHSWAHYLLAQQQLNRDWYTGVRLDYTKNALDDRQSVWGVSPYVTWYWSEFLRFRLEYQHKDGDVKAEDTLYFQAVFIFGAHPPHPYWAMK